MIENTKLSHLTVLGFVQQIAELSNFSLYLVTGVLADLNEELGTPPMARTKYMEVRVSDVAELVSLACRKMGMAEFLATYTEVQSSDVRVVNDAGKVDLSYVKSAAINSRVGALMRSSLGLASIFQWFGERWNTIVHLRYQRLKTIRDWMKTRVELLRLEIAHAEPDSDEYRKRIKTIEAYDDMIGDLDLKISAYMRS
jgi:hypothetical protein